MKELCIDLEDMRKDKSGGSLYYAWQANIAMAFYDEFMRQRNDSEESAEDIHEIANNAAKNFLDMLIKPKKASNLPDNLDGSIPHI